MSKRRDRKLRRVWAQMDDAAWLIDPMRLELILAGLELRHQGYSADEIRAQLGSDQGELRTAQVIDGVGLLPLSGMLAPRANLMSNLSGGASLDQWRGELAQLRDNPDVASIVLDVDSPGGASHGVAETAAAVRAAAAIKPVEAVANNVMASAAYWVGSAATRVSGAPGADVGNIGVYTIHTDDSGEHAQAGRKRTVIAAGKLKAAGLHGPLTSEARAARQSRIDEIYNQFTDAVAEYRGTTGAAVRSGFGQGASVSAERAASENMIDRVATLGQVLDEHRRAAADRTGGRSKRAAGLAAAAPDPSLTPGPPANLPPITTPTGAKPMLPELTQMLVDQGLISTAATDEVADQVLSSVFAAHGQPLPEDPAEQLAAYQSLRAALAPPAAPVAPPAAPVAPVAPQAAAFAPVAAPVDPPVAPVASVAADAIATAGRLQGAADERQRTADIRAACTAQQLSSEQTEQLIAMGLDFNQTMGAMAREQVRAAPPVPAARGGSVVPGKSADDRLGDVFVELLSTPREDYGDLSVAAAENAGLSMIDMTRLALAQHMGEKAAAAVDKNQLARYAFGDTTTAAMLGAPLNSPSAIPNVLRNTINKQIRPVYTGAPTTYQVWTNRLDSVENFNEIHLPQLTEAGNPEKLPDAVAYAEEKISDQEETIIPDDYGKKWAFTDRMYRQDNRRALLTWPRQRIVAAARFVNQTCYQTLASNPEMADGTPVFDASRNNLISPGGAPGKAQYASMRKVLRRQKGQRAETILNSNLRFVIGPAELETEIGDMTNPTDVGGTNSTARNQFQQVTPVIEGYLDEFSVVQYWGVGDPQQIETLGVVFLSDFDNGPLLDSWFDPDKRVTWFAMRIAFGVGFIDFRNLVLNAGQ